MTPVNPSTIKAIEELKPLAAKLNKESDDLNETITAISNKLASLNLGIEVWYEDHDDDQQPDAGDVQVGFARTEEGGKACWGLAARTFYEPMSEYEGQPLTYRVTPLIKASREVRIVGLETVPWIIAQLKEGAKEKLEVIAEAKRIAAKL